MRNANMQQRGFTLLELMVGMTLGLLTVWIVFQLLITSGFQRATVAAGSDAEINANLAAYSLQTDVRMAGYGITSDTSAIGCTMTADLNGTTTTQTLAPVIITDGGGSAPDSITVLGSNSSQYALPLKVNAAHTQTATSFSVDTNLSVSADDLMVAVPTTLSDGCTLFQATAVDSSSLTISNASGSSLYNNTSIFPSDGYPIGSFLVDLGTFQWSTWSVSSDHILQLKQFDSSTAGFTTTDAVTNIVNLQAVYGKDTDSDGAVDTWNVTAPTTQAEWQQVLAVRIAVVARSERDEKEEVTPSALEPSWTVGGTTSSLIGNLDSSSRARYRYRVIDTVIPLRNMIWSS